MGVVGQASSLLGFVQCGNAARVSKILRSECASRANEIAPHKKSKATGWKPVLLIHPYGRDPCSACRNAIFLIFSIYAADR